MTWEPAYILVIIFCTVITYIGSCKITSASESRKKLWLYVVLFSNIGLLIIFKYLNFFLGNLQLIFPNISVSSLYTTHNIILPIGISFYAFQAISYCIDVYKNNYIPEKHFGKFSLYLSFFPKLLAGPIERANDLLPQFNNYHKVNIIQSLNGVKRILWGLFKKVIIADKLSLIVDSVYGVPYEHSGLSLLLSTYLFAFQIYCDFSGYCDIAIGTAQLFGYKLSENFQKPYFAISIPDFWKRWHITLMSWFRDYVYIGLGGKRSSTLKWYRNILIVFLLSGLWHGASWNFVLWGLIHGLFYLFSIITIDTRNYINNKLGLYNYRALHKSIKIIVTFNLVSFSWIFFRAKDLSIAIYIIKAIFSDLISLVNYTSSYSYSLLSMFNIQGIPQFELITYLILLLFFLVCETLNWIERYCYNENLNNISFKELLLLNMMIISLVFLSDIGGNSFLYFKF